MTSKTLSCLDLYSAGTIAYAAAFSIFAYFVYTSYQAAISQAFIAVDDSSGKCETVPIAITSNYLADSNGNWEGSPAFDYSTARYSFSFNNFQVDSFSQYQQMMTTYYTALQGMGRLAEVHNLPYNLLLWATFVRYYSVDYPDTYNYTSVGFGQLQYLQMTGDAQQIYQLSTQVVTIGSYRGSCPQHAHTTFDRANALIETELDYNTYANNPLCADALPTEQFGYQRSVDNGVFSLSLNVETFMMVMSVNLGIVNIGYLTVASSDLMYIELGNTSYSLAEYYDQRYLEMEPMWCIRNVTPIVAPAPDIETLCFYTISRALAIPVFEHVGESVQQPIYCDCDTNGQSSSCNVFNLLSGLIFFPIENAASYSPVELVVQQISYLMQLIAPYESYGKLNSAAYNATWTLGTQVFGLQKNYYRSSKWYESAFDFLQIPTGLNGSMLIFTSDDAVSHLVSKYKYSLTNGSCSNSFAITPEAW